MNSTRRSLFGMSRKKHKHAWVLDGSALEPTPHTLIAGGELSACYRRQLEEQLFPAQDEHCERFLRDVVALHERSCRYTVPISSSRHVSRLPTLVGVLEAFFRNNHSTLQSISAMVLNHSLKPLAS